MRAKIPIECIFISLLLTITTTNAIQIDTFLCTSMGYWNGLINAAARLDVNMNLYTYIVRNSV